MGASRKTRIALKIQREWSIRIPASSLESWCDCCGRRVRFVGPEEAAALAPVPLQTLSLWVDEGSLHAGETPSGAPLFCLSSLVRQIYNYAHREIQP